MGLEQLLAGVLVLAASKPEKWNQPHAHGSWCDVMSFAGAASFTDRLRRTGGRPRVFCLMERRVLIGCYHLCCRMPR